MYSDARLLVASSNHSLVHVHAIHPLSAMPRQQGGVDVQDLFGIRPEDRIGDLVHEPRQHDVIDRSLG